MPGQKLFRTISWVAALTALAGGCQSNRPAGGGKQATGTVITAASLSGDTPHIPMPQRLQLIEKTIDPDAVLHMNRVKADRLKAILDGESDPKLLLSLLPKYAEQLLFAGDPEAALVQFDRLEALLKREAPRSWATEKPFLRMNQAIAYMRIGEQENCQNNHTSESCLVPIQGKGIHQLPRGSRGAIKVLQEILRDNPSDIAARWLLNIAYMTLGEYPGSVPDRWRIPPESFKSDFPLTRFPEIGSNLGLDLKALSGGVIVDDFNNDECLDILISSIGFGHQLRLFINDQRGGFTERTQEAGLLGETGGLNLIQTDYNNDGFLDAMVLRGAWFRDAGRWPLSLLRNNGNGTFTNVTEDAGLLRFRPTQTAVWLDYNSDGWLDLFVGNESEKGTINPCELFRNNRNGTFTDCAKECGLDKVTFVKGVISSDYNNDGRPDLYLSVLAKPNILLRNDGPVSADKSLETPYRFTDVTKAAGVAEPLRSFSCFFFDYNNDGWQDLFVTGYEVDSEGAGEVAKEYLGISTKLEQARLFRNRGDGTFADESKMARVNKVVWTMGINYGDLDNDGWLDFYLGTGNPNLGALVPNRMFRNAGGKYFQDVTTAGGFGHLQKGHAIGFGDMNNDGDQDIYESMGGIYDGDTAYSAFYENPGFSNHWLTLSLQGVESNRAALGARLRVVINTPSGPRALYRTVSSGGSFGASTLRQEIGLGNATSIVRVEIQWPKTGKTQVVEGLEMDHFYRIREDQPTPTRLNPPSFPFKSGGHSQHQHHH